MSAPTPADMPRQRPRRQRAPQYAADHLLGSHARMRMREFGLSKDDVALVLTDWENRYDSRARGHGPATVYQRGDWAVIVCRDEPKVITVVRRRIEHWEH